MITLIADMTAYLIDHLTVVLIIAVLALASLAALWMLILFLLSWNRWHNASEADWFDHPQPGRMRADVEEEKWGR